MTKRIKGIHHIALKCQGEEAYRCTVSFYRDILGMPVVRSWGSGANQGMMLDTGSGLMELFSDADDTLPTGAIRHFALSCDDVDACIDDVRKGGYQITVEPKDIVIPAAIPYLVRIAFCIGPVGEEIEFFQEMNCDR